MDPVRSWGSYNAAEIDEEILPVLAELKIEEV
jgi:hypothetical protein